jgi:hypothetical protein
MKSVGSGSDPMDILPVALLLVYVCGCDQGSWALLCVVLGAVEHLTVIQHRLRSSGVQCSIQ